MLFFLDSVLSFLSSTQTRSQTLLFTHFVKNLFSQTPPISRTMSSCPSTFDILMSNASKKKTSQRSYSGKKRKTQEPDTLNSLNPNQTNHTSEIPISTQTGEALNENEPKIVNSSENDVALVVKKPRVTITPDESLAELKKKAANFDPKKALYLGKGHREPFMFVVKELDAIS